jgi:hypothetical protein
MSSAFGRFAATCLTLGALALCLPAASLAASDHYFSATLGGGTGYASGSANAYSTFTDGAADHNAFCASWVAGIGGTYTAPGNGNTMGYSTSCSVSGGYASVSAPGGISASALHGTVWTNYGYGSLIWDFTTATHYSW